MSDPVTNVQIEDVLSSIRRLVSEEIGQQPANAPIKLEKKVEDEAKLVLSPAQKVRAEAAEQGRDLWNETEDLGPKEAAPVWWHRDLSEMTSFEASEPMQLEQPLVKEAQEAVSEDQDEVLEVAVELIEEEVVAEEAPLEGALAGLEAAKDIHDDEWESPEGDEDMDAGGSLKAMPWQGNEDHQEYIAVDAPNDFAPEPIEETAKAADETSAVEKPDDAPFTFRPGERLFERLSSKKMSASHLPDVETVEAAEALEPETIETERNIHFMPEVDDSLEDVSFEDDDLDAEDLLASSEMSNIFDEDMLRDMVKDIIRQELQGVLGERITRNVRKLVRREIQRALSDITS